MAFPNPVSFTTSLVNSNGLNHVVDLPATVVAGETLILLFSHSTTGQTITFPSGWNAITNGAGQQTAGSDQGFATAWRKADGTEGGTTITVQTSANARSSSIVVRIQSAADPTVSAPAAATAIGINANADPPSLSPAGGAKDYLWLACGANSHSSVYTAGPANYSNLTQVQAAGVSEGTYTNCGVATRQLNAASENPGAYTGANALAEWVGITIAIYPSSGQSVSVGQSTETDTSQTFGKQKTKTFAQITEINLAQAITAISRYVLGQVTETDTARLFSKRKIKALGQVVETNVAQSISAQKIFSVTQVSETNTAQSLSVVKAATVAQVEETDTAFPISSIKYIPVGTVVETNVANSFITRKIHSLSTAEETNTAQSIAEIKQVSLQQTIETDTVFSITPETGGGQTNVPVEQVTETDTAFGISVRKIISFQQAVEANVSQSLIVRKVILVQQVQETSTVQQLFPRKQVSISQVVEVDVAQPIAQVGYKQIQQVEETDIAQGFSVQKIVIIGQAFELDTALSISKQSIRLLGMAQELDFAGLLISMIQILRAKERLYTTQLRSTEATDVRAVQGMPSRIRQTTENRKVDKL